MDLEEWKAYVKEDDKRRIVIFSPEGLIENEELAQMAIHCRKIAHQKKYKFLIDFRKANLCAGYLAADQWFKRYFKPEEMYLTKIKTAFIAIEEMRELFEYVDETWPSKGINIKVFAEETKAFKWLGIKMPTG